MLAAILILMFAYFIGAVPTGYWIGKLLKGIDIRTVGSGSTGATNVLRSVGKVPAAFVLLFDMFKGAFPVLLGIASSQNPGAQIIPLPQWLTISVDPAFQQEPLATFANQYVLACIAGIISMIGHSKSIFLGFQGGKSAATGLGSLMAMNLPAGLCMFLVFVSTIAIGRIVSVGSMMAAVAGPLLMYLFGAKISFVIYNIIGSSYVIIRHKSNIKRLLNGTEPKIGQKVETVVAIALGISLLAASSASIPVEAKTSDSKAKTSKSQVKTNDVIFKSDLPSVFAQAPTSPITQEESTNIKVYKLDSKAVVNVTTVNVTPEAVMYGINPPADTGSGSIISPDGYILTNNHVVNGASMVRVTLFDGTPFPAKLVGVDPDNDLAVLKIDPGTRKLSTIKFGDSSRLEVGRRVYAIGNPFGLDLTMTSGIISSVGRTMRTENGRIIKGVLQTDAAINPGNSGGPLLDTQGSMIGVTTAILSKVQQSAGIGFAIPINVVKRIVPQIVAHGAVLRPNLGILKVTQTELGLMIAALDPTGPAAEAGLKGPSIRRGKIGAFDFVQVDNSTADTIVGIDKERVASVDDLLSYCETKKPGQVVTLNVLRQGQLVRIPVKLAETKAQP